MSTKQNGIWQTWAPRYTMFSRGNIKEKARIRGFHDKETALNSKRVIGTEERTVAVDLYAGIGYFVFSYAAAGFKRVWCWEINPWSVEGLKRGAQRNQWSVQVFKDESLNNVNLELDVTADATIVVFEEGNEFASTRMGWNMSSVNRPSISGNVKHVNCGFLPSSETSWRTAVSAVIDSDSAWLHLHENIGYHDIDARKTAVELLLRSWVTTGHCIDIEHVELVKSFAPGVWHCVFDVHIAKSIT